MIAQSVRTEIVYHCTIAVSRGHLVYAPPIETRGEYQGEQPLWDSYACPLSRGKYARLPEYGLTADSTGTKITATAFLCAEWGEKNGSADQPPVRPLMGTAQKEPITLVLYAQAYLRIAHFPECRAVYSLDWVCTV